MSLLKILFESLDRVRTYSQDLDQELIPDPEGSWVDIHEVFEAVNQAVIAAVNDTTSKIPTKPDTEE